MSPTKLLHALVVILSLLLQSPAHAQVQPAPALPDLQSAGPLGEDIFLQSGLTGMVLVVVRGNQVYFRGYGETAPGSHLLPTQNSVLRLCSLTKIFTTDVLAKLAADGTVQLNDPLQRYAPRHTVVPTRVQPITLADLATHTSGLPRELATPPRNTPHFTYPDYRTRWRWLPNQHLRTTPGTAALYSNLAFDFLGDALQSAAHKQYAAILAERTLNPLRMYNTTFFPNPDQCSHLLLGTHDEGPCTITEETAGSSGLYSTATDMAIWLQYLLRTGGNPVQKPIGTPDPQAVYLVPSDLVSTNGLNHVGDPTGIGLGWIHLLPPDDPSHIIEKTGGGAGFTTYIAINHYRNTAIFLAATDGDSEARFNLFNSANNLLLTLSGLPPLPPPLPKPVKPVKHTHHRRSH